MKHTKLKNVTSMKFHQMAKPSIEKEKHYSVSDEIEIVNDNDNDVTSIIDYLQQADVGTQMIHDLQVKVDVQAMFGRGQSAQLFSTNLLSKDYLPKV